MNMGAASPAENTPNASRNFSRKCLAKPKSSSFLIKAHSGCPQSMILLPQTPKKNIIDSPQLCRWGKMEKMQLLFIMGIVLFLSYVSNSGKYQRIFLILSIASCTKKQHHLPSTLQVGKVGEEATVIRYGNCSIFSPPFDRTFALSYEQWALFPFSV